MGLMGDMIVELRQVVSSLRKSVASEESLEKFNRTVSNLESVSSSLADYMERNEAKLDETANNFLSASRNVKDLLRQNRASVDSTLARADRASVRLEQFTIQLDSLALSARRFAEVLETEEGTLQLMMQDRRLYDDLRQTADNIDDLISDIRENPRKYINLSVELF
jgi:phospholipid/cholesterol/gamma-HCH transport system substrate-binding protein